MTAKSDRAKELLNDPLLKEAFEHVENAIIRGWKNTPPTARDQQEEWHRRLFTLESVKKNLELAVRDGTLEDFHVAQSEEPGFLGNLKWQKNKRLQ